METIQYDTIELSALFGFVQIVDVETGKALGSNEEGELWIRGPQVSSGYYGLPAQTRELFQEDGWVRTGTDCI